MNDQQLFQRQQQIYRLHKKIKQYKLTSDEALLLQRNQQQQELMIESKFISSKVNKNYKFPKVGNNDDEVDGQMIGYKDICNLNEPASWDSDNRIDNGNSRREADRRLKSPEIRHTTDYAQRTTIKLKPSDIARDSYSPRGVISKILSENRFKDSAINYNSRNKESNKQLHHYLSTSNDKTNDKSYHTLRMATDSYEIRTSNIRESGKLRDKGKERQGESSLCQSIKSVIRVKNSLMGGMKKEVKVSESFSKQYESIKPQHNIKLNKLYKNTIANKGKQNQNKLKYNITNNSINNKKLTYNSYMNTTINKYTQHDKSLKQWNRSYYNPNSSKDTYAPTTTYNKSINGLYSSLNHKESVLSNKWLNTTQNQDYKSLQKYSISNKDKKPLKKKQSLYYNNDSKTKYTISSSHLNQSSNYKSFKSSLNNTTNLKSKGESSKHEMYFSKVFQSIRGKASGNGNKDSVGEGLYSSCSRIPLASPLSYKYLEYKQGITLTNR